MHNAFSMKTDGVFNFLITDVLIRCNGKEVKIKALWDTGASKSAVDVTVASHLGLLPVDKISIGTADGVKTLKNQYILEEVVLPNNVIVQTLKATEANISEQGIHMLIGMDIIASGNFTITHKEPTGMTFSFSAPPFGAEIDYVQRVNDVLSAKRKQGKKKRKK